MTGMWRRWLIIVGFVPALAACGFGLACTSAGCVSAVFVDVSSVRTVGAVATLCVDGACQATTLSAGMDQLMAPVSEERGAGDTVEVTLQIERDGSAVVESRTSAVLVESAPNGKQCGPVCHSAALKVQAGELVPAPA